jgi:hypothetical protein
VGRGDAGCRGEGIFRRDDGEDIVGLRDEIGVRGEEGDGGACGTVMSVFAARWLEFGIGEL